MSVECPSPANVVNNGVISNMIESDSHDSPMLI